MVDPTYNSSSGKQWFLCGGEAMTSTHLEDGSVSSSGYKLKYPALKPYDYGNDKDSNGMTIIGEYIGEGSHRQLDLHVSYDGKGAVYSSVLSVGLLSIKANCIYSHEIFLITVFVAVRQDVRYHYKVLG